MHSDVNDRFILYAHILKMDEIIILKLYDQYPLKYEAHKAILLLYEVQKCIPVSFI